MKTVHYSREGYEGKYTYNSVCGKSVNTHEGKDDVSIHPELATCEHCRGTKEFKDDLLALYALSGGTGIKRRIYIESDILQADEFRSAQREAFDFAKDRNLKCVDRVFSDVLDRAWHDLEKTWEAVKLADEIYATSSFIPLCGNPSMGAPVIFNGMCERAVKEKITGKTIIILNDLKNISWDYIDIKMMKKAFKENSLYMYNEEYDLVKVDISKIK